MRVQRHKQPRMRTLFTLFASIALCASLLSQTYTGKLGYSISPLGFPDDLSQFGPFLQEVSGTCGNGVLMANGSWRDSLNTSGNIPTLHNTISQLQPSPYGYTDLLVYAWATYPTLHLTAPNDSTNNWSNASTRNLFLQALIRSADSLQPAYIFVGNEVSFYIAQDSADYANWCSFYSMAYDSIKFYSPNTKVGTVFNYEHLSGNGTVPGWTAPHWNALLDMDTSKMDIVGLTFYPFLKYNSADSVPMNYLDPLFNRIGNIPLAITETGWPGDSLIGPWSASPQEQVDWVNNLFTMINGRNVEVVNWLFLNYMMNRYTVDDLLAKSISMRDSLGNDRPALAVWLSYCPSTTAQSHEPSSGQFHIYPNPATDRFILESKMNYGESCTMKLYDLFGREVKSVSIVDQKTEIELSGLAPGVYLYEVSGNGEIKDTGKLVIEN